MTAGDWRRFWLFALFAFDTAMLICWWFAEKFFFWTFVGINVVVITGEVISMILRKKTLSTATTQAIQYDTKKRILVYLALSFLVLGMMSLAFHLVIV